MFRNLYLDYKGYNKTAKFKIPYINGKYLIGILLIATGIIVYNKFGIAQIKESITEKPLLVIL